MKSSKHMEGAHAQVPLPFPRPKERLIPFSGGEEGDISFALGTPYGQGIVRKAYSKPKAVERLQRAGLWRSEYFEQLALAHKLAHTAFPNAALHVEKLELPNSLTGREDADAPEFPTLYTRWIPLQNGHATYVKHGLSARGVFVRHDDCDACAAHVQRANGPNAQRMISELRQAGLFPNPHPANIGFRMEDGHPVAIEIEALVNTKKLENWIRKNRTQLGWARENDLLLALVTYRKLEERFPLRNYFAEEDQP